MFWRRWNRNCPAAASKRTQSRYGAVFVGSLAESAGMRFQAVFVPGLNEGILPKTGPRGPAAARFAARTARHGGQRRRHAGSCVLPSPPRRNISPAPGRASILPRAASACPPSMRSRLPSPPAPANLTSRPLPERRAAPARPASAGPRRIDPDDAVDAAEYDLAFLRPHWDQPRPGEAAWLKLVNPHVYRSLLPRADFAGNRRGRGPTDLLDADVHVGLATGKTLRPFPSFLRADAAGAICPLPVPIPPAIHPRPPGSGTTRRDSTYGPCIRGELYHAVQSRFYAALQADEQLLPSATSSPPWSGWNRSCARSKPSSRIAIIPAIPVVWQTDMERIRGDLRAWLRHVAAHENDWTPIHFEYGFRDVADRRRSASAGPRRSHRAACERSSSCHGSQDRHAAGSRAHRRSAAANRCSPPSMRWR